MYAANVCLLTLILCTYKINAQSEWPGKWFPYDPSHGPESSSSTTPEPGLKNCDPNEPGCVFGVTGREMKEWNGKWFPEKVKEKHEGEVPLKTVKMGNLDETCDDGETKLYVDYDGNPENYTCYEDKALFLPNATVHPLHEKEQIPVEYTSEHLCMNESISYSLKLPTFGPHRPIWPKFGEYSFVPVQRWLHTIEHGGIVMLYHPCANKNQVETLKKVVSGCLYRHLISANRDLTPERPIVLLAWGHRLFMSKVNEHLAIKFIKKFAGRGPEYITYNGHYKLLLNKRAKIVSDEFDEDFCPTSE